VDKRVASNALNYFLSKKFTYDGTDYLAITEIVRDLQEIIGGHTSDPESGHPQTDGDVGPPN
jgi:hypothetical protein